MNQKSDKNNSNELISTDKDCKEHDKDHKSDDTFNCSSEHTQAQADVRMAEDKKLNTYMRIKDLYGFIKQKGILHKITLHFIIMAFIGCLVLVPMNIFNDLIEDRKGVYKQDKEYFMKLHGPYLIIASPIIYIPLYKKTQSKLARRTVIENKRLIIIADTVKTTVDLKISPKSHGLYKGNTFSADVRYKGIFSLKEFEEALDDNFEVGTPSLFISQNKNIAINAINKIEVCGTKFKVESEEIGYGLGYVQADIQSAFLKARKGSGVVDFDISLVYQGTQGLTFRNFSKRNKVSIKGTGAEPFLRPYLKSVRDVAAKPIQSHIADKSFCLEYDMSRTDNVSNYKNMHTYLLLKKAPGVGLDFKEYEYMGFSLIDRLIDYVFLFAAVVYTAIFAFEITVRRFLNVLQLGVLGLALCMFYLLLLAVSEFVLFAYAYAFAALAVVIMTGAYIHALFKKKVYTLVMLCIMCVTYFMLYVILHIQNYALIIGTGFMLLILALAMYATTKLSLVEIKR